MDLSRACWMHACVAEAHVDAAPTDDSANEGAPLMDAHLSADEQTLLFQPGSHDLVGPLRPLLRAARAVDGGQS